MARDKIATNDRQLACARINSEEGQSYLKVCQHLLAWHSCSKRVLVLQPHAGVSSWLYVISLSRHCAVPHVILVPLQAMACAANYAWVNRSSMTFLCRQAFAKLFKQSPDELDMNVIYDVSHNIAKVCNGCSG